MAKGVQSAMLKVIAVCGGCGLLAVAAGALNIWLGILLVPVLYEIADSILS